MAAVEHRTARRRAARRAAPRGAGLQAGAEPRAGAASRTSRSRSRSSRSWPAASRPTARRGTTAARSRSRGAGRSSRPDPDHRLLHVRARVGLPDGRRHLLVGVEARRPGLGLVHRLVQPDRPVAVIASVDYGCATFLNAMLGLYERRPLRAELRRRLPSLRRRSSLFALILLLHVVHQHPRQPPRRDAQRHLGLVARRRRRGDHRDPRSSSPTTTRASTSSSPSAINNSGFGAGHVLVLRAAARLPADAVHDHRLRLLARTSPRRRTDAEKAAPKGVWRSVFYSARDRLDRAAGDHVRGRRPGRGQRAAAARSLGRSSTARWRPPG